MSQAQQEAHQPNPGVREEIHSPSPRPSTDIPAADLTTATAAQAPGSMEVTTRTDLSVLYRVLRAVIKPLRPRLVRPKGAAQPTGSPRLSPPRKRDVEITEMQCEEGVWMYRFRAAPGKGPGSRSVGKDKAAVDGGVGRRDGQTNTTRHQHHRVYYFCGGGFQSPPAPEHWRFLAQLTHDLASHHHSNEPDVDDSHDLHHPDTETEIEPVLVSYPLAPTNPASASLRILRHWLKKVMDEAVEGGETLSLMGDSSGGNVVLSLGFWAAQEYVFTPPSEQQQGQQRAGPPVADDPTKTNRANGTTTTTTQSTSPFPLRSLISISPPTDLTNSNPDIRKADKLDPVLTAGFTREVAEVWTTGKKHPQKKPSAHHEPLPLADPSVSPLLQPDVAFHALKDRGVNVHGVVGTHDVLAPDAIEFLRKCKGLGVRGRWLVWEGQMHCFPLAGGAPGLGIREGTEAREFLARVLRRDCVREEYK
ncbi:uncharacterized protein Z520_05416 [Fonsecaea multimorphosa CBS 102226]|uniref:Alpha/beta hydrolase fold-3 domain-containing protein n=1 Tax=Fonsecaea multimorphosa CBS 102226 TaxID=1442371 RepID=A0A0D2HAQ2_9EURO|nr:uncharacterized protein Z520_05416 [Fonsecaea multimorphosa CBS 102226]KIX98955.1 hypothetical protein Z520_05416 [Fonsecaea multimorphosa CBS 102226]OAL25227.1 hypothetical protein AYO22_05104 [Fonsecaea multimorphosa]